MPQVTIYTRPWCPYCRRAKDLLRAKGVDFDEIDIEGSDKLEAEMVARAQGRDTVPQIFIDGHHVGGCDDLHELDREGGLDRLLGASA